MSTLRLGVVGAGSIARAEHLPRFRAIDGVELAAVVNRSPESTRRVADEEGIPRTFERWEDLVADDGIDAVVVATWPDQHAAVTVAALEAGKHVLTEARMSATLDDAQAMAAAAAAHPDLVAMVVPASFSLWADRTLASALANRAIGTVRHARVVWDAAGSVAPSEHWRWQRAHSGVNVMALGILAESMARWLGPATAAQATGRILQPSKPGPSGPVVGDVVDHLLVIAEYPAGVTASIEMSIATVTGGTRIELLGDDGVIDVGLASGTLTRMGRDGSRAPIEIRPQDRLGWTAEIDFVRSIREGAPVELTDFPTGVAYMAFVDAVDLAVRSGHRVVVGG
jgi:predicted dehydrogenase